MKRRAGTFQLPMNLSALIFLFLTIIILSVLSLLSAWWWHPDAISTPLVVFQVALIIFAALGLLIIHLHASGNPESIPALAQEQKRFKDFADASSDWQWECNEQLQFSYLSDRFNQVTGLDPSEFLGKTRREIGNKSATLQDDQWELHLADLEAHRPFRDFTYRVVCSDNKFRWLNVSGLPVFLSSGKFCGYRGSGRDVTEKLEAEQHTKEGQRLLQVTIENMPDGVSIQDENLNLIAFNQAFLDLLDFPSDTFTYGDNLEKFFRYNADRGEYGPGDPAQQVAERIELAKRFESHVFQRTRPDGRVIEIRGKSVPGGGFVTLYVDMTERVNAESEMRLAAEAFQAHEGIVIADSAGTILRVNRAFCEITGYSSEEVVGRNPRLLQSGLHDQAFYQELWRQLIQEGNWEGEIWNRSKSGRIYPEWLSITAVYDASGKTTHYVSHFQDISERKQAEALLQNREKRLRDAQRLASVGSWEVDLVDGQMEWTEQMQRIFEVNLDNFQNLEQALFENIHPNDRDKSEALYQQSMTDCTPLSLKFRLLFPENRIVYIDLLGEFIFSEQGIPLKWVGTAQDVSKIELIRNDAELSRQRLKDAIEALNEGFVFYDSEDRLVMCNERYRQIYPIGAEMMEEGNTFEDIVRYGVERGEYVIPEGWDKEEWIADRVARHQNPPDNPIEQHLGDGTWLQINECHTRDGGIAGVRTDITRLKMAEEALRDETVLAEKMAAEAQQANQAKSTFIASISHELRTPLNGVLGMVQVLDSTDLDNEQLEYLNTIEQSARALLLLVDDLLDLAKIEANKVVLEHIEFDMERLIYDVGRLLSPSSAQKDLDLIIHYPVDMPRHLIGDPGRIRQIFLNLLGNAIKFTLSGHVLLEVKSILVRGDQVQFDVVVEDTGIGIPENAKTLIFDHFSQADASTTRHFGGTGLGLSICKLLVEKMGGEISLESVEGKGSEFVVHLTLPVASVSVPPQEHIPLKGGRVLVVGGRERERSMITRQLSDIGFYAVTSADVDDGIYQLSLLLESGAVNAIIVNWPIDSKSCWEFCRRLDVDATLRSIPRLLLTSLSRCGDAKDAADSGFSAYLPKPVSPAILSNILLVLKKSDDTEKLDIDRNVKDTSADDNERSVGTLTGRVLIVEDNLVNQRVALALLANLGIEADVLENGKEALDRVKDSTYDLILMDCQMPVMDGFQATREIRAQERTGRQPIVALTANVSAEDIEGCYDAGMDGFLPKPLELSSLKQELEKWLTPAVSVQTDSGDSEFTNQGNTLSGEIILNEIRLRELSDLLGEDDFPELLTVFKGDAADILNQLHNLSIADQSEIYALAHKLKSSASNVGVIQVSDVAKKIEADAKAGSLIDFQEKLEYLENVVDTALNALADWG